MKRESESLRPKEAEVIRITAENVEPAQVPYIEQLISNSMPCEIAYGNHADQFIAALLGYRAVKEKYRKGYRYALERRIALSSNWSDVDILVEHYGDEDNDLSWVWSAICPRMATSFMGIESILRYASDRWGVMSIRMYGDTSGKHFDKRNQCVCIQNKTITKEGLIQVHPPEPEIVHPITKQNQLKECVYYCVRDAYNAELAGEFTPRKEKENDQ